MSTIFLFFSLLLMGIGFIHGLGNNITVTWIEGWDCKLEFQGDVYRCALGKNGVTSSKKEGDGKTPLGQFQLRRAFYRQDRGGSNNCYGAALSLNCRETETSDGWVDEPTDPLYNQLVTLPYDASHENLYLTDSSAYDLMAVIGYNDDSVIPYAGSAIFFHVTNSNYGGTAGCVAMDLNDLSSILQRVTADTWMIIQRNEGTKG